MDVSALFNAMPGAIAQGLIWGIMAIGVYITFRILDIADLSVDGTMCTGAAVCIMLMQKGYHVAAAMAIATLAGMLVGLVTGLFHTTMGIPAILAGILTQLGLWGVNLKIMGKANQPINVDKYDLAVSLRYIKRVAFYKNSIFVVFLFMIVVIGILYWFFGTELGSSLRATGCNENMAETQEDMTTAYSGLMDTDMASEMTEYTQQNILEQAAVSVLSQANDIPQQVLSLLQK